MKSQSLLFLGLVPLVHAAETAESHEVHASQQQGFDAMSAAVVDEAIANAMTNETASESMDEDMTEEMYFGVDIGVPQTLYDEVEAQQVASIAQARLYMQQEIWVRGPNVCSNQNEYCAYYAVTGECERVPDFMRENCAPMCRMCDPNAGYPTYEPAVYEEDPNCPVDFGTNAWANGDLDKMFERIISTPEYQKYEPKVLSRPSLAEGDTADTADYIVGGPWMIVFDNLVSEEEADRLVDLGGIEGYDRSKDVASLNSDGSVAPGVSVDRTSTNAWCR